MVRVFCCFGLVWFWIFKLKLFWVICQSHREQSIFYLFNFFYASWMSIPSKEFPIVPLSIYLFNSLLDSIVNFICHCLISIPNLCNKKIKGFFFNFSFLGLQVKRKILGSNQSPSRNSTTKYGFHFIWTITSNFLFNWVLNMFYVWIFGWIDWFRYLG